MSADAHAVGDATNVQQGPDDGPPPSDGGGPQQDEGHHDMSGPRRHSTMLGKYKYQKQKIKDKTNPPGGFDPKPIPDAPPGYTIKFTFHRAENLPVADISTGASDPFITAHLSTSLLKRHKEDPDLCFRTRTVRRDLEPVWEEDWIVANVPASGFRLKCRLYDEDWPDHNDRLGNVTIYVHGLNESWQGYTEKVFDVKKRMGSKRAYLLKAGATALHSNVSMTPRLYVSAVMLGKSDPPHGQIYTVGPTYYFQHFSPMIGRMTGIKVNRDPEGPNAPNSEQAPTTEKEAKAAEKKAQKYDFQAIEIQLAGPVPPRLYHRFVEFRPIIGLLFQGAGLRGRLLNKALHHQHERIYNFDSSTDWGMFRPCSEEASLQLLKLAHFDEGYRVFTYIITLDGMLRFTETGKEFGIDLLSKHTMHSDAQIYIAISGEFYIRKKKHPKLSAAASSTKSPRSPEKGPYSNARPQHYQLIIDNDSGTYRPDKVVLPDLGEYLGRNFPGLEIVTLGCDDEDHQKRKEEQRELRKKSGQGLKMVLNRSPSSSSFSSSDLSELDEIERNEDAHKSKRERAWEFLEDPTRVKEAMSLSKSKSKSAEDGPSASQSNGAHVGGGGGGGGGGGITA